MHVRCVVQYRAPRKQGVAASLLIYIILNNGCSGPLCLEPSRWLARNVHTFMQLTHSCPDLSQLHPGEYQQDNI